MAKRRRRRPLKPRPVDKNKQPGEEDMPSTDPGGLADDMAAPAAASIPSTGMPVAPNMSALEEGFAHGGSVPSYAGGGYIRLPNDPGPGFVGRRPANQQGIMRIKPRKGGGGGGGGDEGGAEGGDEGEAFARGGAVPSPMPGYSDYTMMKTDPVARRRYSPRHVKFAEGGYVDAMDYVPDRPVRQPPPVQPSRFDEFNMVGRQEPQVNPMLAADQPTGYAKGGPIAAAQVPAYTTPVQPAPSEANAKLYADMAALRERTINPPPLQLPALSGGSSGDSGMSAAAAAWPGGPPSYAYPPSSPRPITGTAVSPPPAPPQGPAQPVGPWDDAFGQSFDRYAKGYGLPYARLFAEGGAVPDDNAMPPTGGAPNTEGYLRGDNAMDPQELDAALQQIAQLDPSQSEDAVNLTAIVQAAQSGDMDRAASILAGFRRRFDSLNAHAQGAAAHGDLNAAAQLAGKAHSQVPDGLQVKYHVGQDGSTVVAMITPTGQTFQMTGQQFHDYLVGPATSFDHILENGLEKNLAIASGGQGGQRAPGPNPAPTGYTNGGAADEDDEEEEGMARGGPVRGYAQSGPLIYPDDDAVPNEPGRKVYPNDKVAPKNENEDENDSHEQEKAAFRNEVRGMPGYARGGPVRGYDDGGDVQSYVPETNGQDALRQQQMDEERRRQAEATAAAQQQSEQREQYRGRPEPEAWQTPRGGEDRLTSGAGSPYDPTGSKAQAIEPPERQTVKEVLNHTRAQYGMGDGAAPTGGQDQSNLSRVLDYLHDKVFGSAKAAEPRTSVAAEMSPASPMAGYKGGYGGELTTPPTAPPANALEASQQNPPAIGAPLSLTPDTPPSISGQDTARVGTTPGSSRLAQIEREIAERPSRVDPNDSILTKAMKLPAALLERYSDASRRADAERELYTGSRFAISNTDTPLLPAIRQGVDNLLRGDRAPTLPEAKQILSTISEYPQADHSTMVRKTFNDALTKQGPDAAAQVLQAVRSPFNEYLSRGVTALERGNHEMATKFIELASNIVPNGKKLTLAPATEGGGFIATVRPEGITSGGAQPYTVRLGAGQLHDLLTDKMQFDNFAKNGIDKTLREINTPPQQAARPGLAPGDQPVRPIAPGETGYAESVTRNKEVQDEQRRMQQLGGRQEGPQTRLAPRPVAQTEGERARFNVSEMAGQPTPSTLDTQANREGVQRVIAGADTRDQTAIDRREAIGREHEQAAREAGAAQKQVADRDARSLASRQGFERRVYGQPDPNAPVQSPEQRARGEFATANLPRERERLVSNYNRLVEEAKPRNVYPDINDPRRDPRTETRWAESQSQGTSQGTKTSVSSGGSQGTSVGAKGGGSQHSSHTGSSSAEQHSAQQSASSRTPHTTLVPGAESHVQRNPNAERVEYERQQRALQALKDYGPAPWERPGWHTDMSRPLPPSVYTQGPLPTGQGAPATDVPNKAVQALINEATPARAKEFDAMFGPGAARRILGDRVRY